MIEVAQVKHIINKLYPDSQVILFGSYSRNEQSDLSDIDLLVLFPEEVDVYKKRLLQAIIRKELAKYLIPADVLVFGQKEYQSKRSVVNHIAYSVNKEGILL